MKSAKDAAQRSGRDFDLRQVVPRQWHALRVPEGQGRATTKGTAEPLAVGSCLWAVNGSFLYKEGGRLCLLLCHSWIHAIASKAQLPLLGF